jgi:hypothetical protein
LPPACASTTSIPVPTATRASSHALALPGPRRRQVQRSRGDRAFGGTMRVVEGSWFWAGLTLSSKATSRGAQRAPRGPTAGALARVRRRRWRSLPLPPSANPTPRCYTNTRPIRDDPPRCYTNTRPIRDDLPRCYTNTRPIRDDLPPCWHARRVQHRRQRLCQRRAPLPPWAAARAR